MVSQCLYSLRLCDRGRSFIQSTHLFSLSTSSVFVLLRNSLVTMRLLILEHGWVTLFSDSNSCTQCYLLNLWQLFLHFILFTSSLCLGADDLLLCIPIDSFIRSNCSVSSMSRDDQTLQSMVALSPFLFSVSLPEIRSPLFAAAAETQVPKSKNDPALPFFVGRFHSFGRTERVACFPGQKSRSGLVERFDSTTLNSWPWFGSDRTDHPSIPGPAWRGQRWSGLHV
mmetsp:Transcript_18785/g.39240  ORF Transcript_18785/g.39240 Transcript_18785/m.39240 type:complete len:226 (+) Transcript_18785:60-737(+)